MNLYAELMAAIYRGSAADVAAVLRHAPSLANAVSDTMHAPLLFAAACGRGDVVRALLNAGASLDIRDGHGMTSLMVAADAAQPGALRVLLAAAGGTCAARLETRGSVGFMGEDKFSWNALQVAPWGDGACDGVWVSGWVGGRVAAATNHPPPPPGPPAGGGGQPGHPLLAGAPVWNAHGNEPRQAD